MKTSRKIILGAVIVALATPLLAACASDADVASENLSTAAEQFEITRHITVIDGITDTIELEVEGRCSVETANSALAGALEMTCKVGENKYFKNYVTLSDNTVVTVEQIETADVSLYNYRWIVKPQEIIPNVDVQTNKQ